MLSKLQIKNYALIDALDINFDDKLNIITGETGAGKSIIMGALGLILGNRAESKHFFDESRKCIIEGHFYIKDYNLQDLFNSLDLDYEDTSLIRRELHADGKSRAFVNDTPVTLQTLKVLGEKLIDIHSQHATLQINTESFQLLVWIRLHKTNLYLLTIKRNTKNINVQSLNSNNWKKIWQRPSQNPIISNLFSTNWNKPIFKIKNKKGWKLNSLNWKMPKR